jgi:hypothetical protein
MEESIVVKGRVSDPRHIELEEPLSGFSGKVEIEIRSLAESPQGTKDVMDFIRSLPAGTRTKEDIDRQIQEERSSWGDA